MTQSTVEPFRWTTRDLELLPNNGDHYEIIDGELFVTRAPHWKHQKASGRIYTALDIWSQATQLGETVPAPGVIFSDADNVIPDVVWTSRERLALLLDDAGHLTAAPELIVEVLSSEAANQRRDCEAQRPRGDRDLKLRLYSARGVREYWIIDWEAQQLEIYRRDGAALRLVATLFPQDELTSSLLPGFSFQIASLFS